MRARTTITQEQRMERHEQRKAKAKPAVNHYQMQKYKALRYNYAEIENEEHRELVRQAAVDILAHGKRAKESIIGMGQRLIDVKAILPEWTFTAWVKTEFELSDRMAQNMMNVARQYGERPEIISVLNDTVLYLLSAPSTPESAREEVEKIAVAEGKSPKVARVQRVVRAHKEPPEVLPSAEYTVAEPEPPLFHSGQASIEIVPMESKLLVAAGFVLQRMGNNYRYAWQMDSATTYSVWMPHRADVFDAAFAAANLKRPGSAEPVAEPEPAAPELLASFDAWLAAMPTDLTLRDHLAILELAKGSATPDTLHAAEPVQPC